MRWWRETEVPGLAIRVVLLYEPAASAYSFSASHCDGRLPGSAGRLLCLWTGECLDTRGKVNRGDGMEQHAGREIF